MDNNRFMFVSNASRSFLAWSRETNIIFRHLSRIWFTVILISIPRLNNPPYLSCPGTTADAWVVGFGSSNWIGKRVSIPRQNLGATARSYRRQDGADSAARFEKFLPARASLRPPISLKFTTEKHRGMVHLAPKRQTRTFSRFCTIIPERFAARRR